jgi:hypothetical protein
MGAIKRYYNRLLGTVSLGLCVMLSVQGNNAAAMTKPYSMMADPEISKMLGAIRASEIIRVDIYSESMESPVEPLPNNHMFTRLCRIDAPSERVKIVNLIAELKPAHPAVSGDKTAVSAAVFGDYGPFDLKVVLWRGQHPVFSGVFTLPGENGKFSAGAFSGNRLGVFALDPIRKIESYVKTPDVSSRCTNV